MQSIDFSGDTVYISGTYGSGKSQIVCEHLLRSVSPGSTLLCLAYRQSQAIDFASKLYSYQVPFTQYLDHRTPYISKHRDRILISTQSLGKICPVLIYDTVIIDETTSLMLDTATSHMVPKINLEIMVYVMQTCKKLILMDVNLPDSIRCLINCLRQGSLVTPVPALQVIPKKYTNRIIFEPSEKIWADSIVEDLRMGHNVVVCSDSKDKLLLLCQSLPASTVKRVYCSGHPYAEELKDVDTAWTRFQLVAYSPSIVTATSFTVDHFHVVYGFFTYSALSARCFAQQLHRVRSILCGQIIVHAKKPAKSFLRNQKDLPVCFVDGTILEDTTSLRSRLLQLHNEEIQKTYEDFEGSLLSSIYA